jgi:hypothetical protein
MNVGRPLLRGLSPEQEGGECYEGSQSSQPGDGTPPFLAPALFYEKEPRSLVGHKKQFGLAAKM